MATISERATQGIQPREMSERDKLNHLSERARLAELRWIKANAEADLMEEKKSIFIAEAKLSFRAKGLASSASSAEDMVRASDTYKEFIINMIEARRTANELKAEWRASERDYYVGQSMEAHERAQMRMSR
jgi:hypothetical protein